MLRDLSINASNSRTYVLRINDLYLGVFSLNPVASMPMIPGSTFGGVLDFRDPHNKFTTVHASTNLTSARRMNHYQKDTVNRKVLGFCVMLESEEEIRHKWLPASLRAREASAIKKLYCEHAEVTSDVLVTSFMFTIPATATPSFST